MNNPDDAYETPARDRDQIFERLLCLAALRHRTYAELAPERVSVDFLEDFTSTGIEWLREAGAEGALSPEERVLCEKKPRTWTQQEKVDASWRVEAEAVMAWALGLVSLPAWEQKLDQDLMEEAVSVDTPASEIFERVKPRSRAELVELHEQASHWYGCATAAMPYYQNDRLSPSKRAEMVRHAVGSGEKLFGKDYAQLSPDEFWTARSIARERFYALNWIWDGEDWDHVNIDT